MMFKNTQHAMSKPVRWAYNSFRNSVPIWKKFEKRPSGTCLKSGVILFFFCVIRCSFESGNCEYHLFPSILWNCACMTSGCVTSVSLLESELIWLASLCILLSEVCIILHGPWHPSKLSWSKASGIDSTSTRRWRPKPSPFVSLSFLN